MISGMGGIQLFHGPKNQQQAMKERRMTQGENKGGVAGLYNNSLGNICFLFFLFARIDMHMRSQRLNK